LVSIYWYKDFDQLKQGANSALKPPYKQSITVYRAAIALALALLAGGTWFYSPFWGFV
jgi:hypothetical protein